MLADLFERLMEHDPNLVFVKDEASVIIYANRAFLSVYPPERRPTVIGSTTIENFNESEAAVWLAEDRRAMAVGRSEMVEEVVDFEGRRRVLLTRKIAFTCPTGERRLLGICTDITELADRERALVQANNRLAQVSAFAAHDFRSPLASIVSAVEIVRMDKDTSLSPKAQEVMSQLTTCAFGLAQQVTALVRVAGAERHDDLELRSTDLNLLVEEVRFNLSSLIEQARASLVSARLPDLVVEPSLFRQLLQNLVENAIRHRSKRPPVITIRHAEDDGCDIISIEDNGTGISATESQRMFVEFERGSASRPGEGSGLGLALCRRVVALHGGTIRIDPYYRDGCRIVLTLPRDRRLNEIVTAA